MIFSTTLIGLVTALSQVSAYKITFYASEGCRSGAPVSWVGGPNEGCRQDYQDSYNSVLVKSTGDIDNNFMLVFFSSPDCNPDTEIWHGDENTDSCVNVPSYQSFEIWDLR